jgi:two-component system phosphate regulon sensor histidine kinase PhoR
MKFRTRLFLFYLIIVSVITVFLAAYFINFEEKRVRQTLHEQLLIDIKLIADGFADQSILKNTVYVSRLVNKLAGQTKLRLTVIGTDGRVISDSAYEAGLMPNHKDRPEIKLALTGREGFMTRYSETLKEYLIYVAYPIKINDKIIGVIRLAKSQQQLNDSLLRIRLLIIGGISLATLLAVLLGFFIVFRITKPILELRRLAIRISRGDLSARVRFFGQDELADLGLTFNKMAERLTHSFEVINEEKRKLEVILANIVDGILVIDRNLQIVMANPAAQIMLSLDPANIQGRPVLEALLNHHLLELIQKVNQAKTALESDLLLHYPSNKQIQVLLAPLQDESGVITGSIVILHDLTQLRRLERVRQDFVANVSHELRTPITSIKAMAETLIGGGWQDTEIFIRYLRAIDQESDRMSNLINDLLALAKLDSKTEVIIEPFDLVNLINETKEHFGMTGSSVPEFTIVLPSEPLPKINANRDQVKQVLTNLLDNAFKYTSPEGKIKLTVLPEGNCLKISISDTGIGIPSDEIERIFERFYRVDKARSRAQGGTGLGLSIVKNIVESYGGKVEVKSILNQGSEFYFTVPTVSE